MSEKDQAKNAEQPKPKSLAETHPELAKQWDDKNNA